MLNETRVDETLKEKTSNASLCKQHGGCVAKEEIPQDQEVSRRCNSTARTVTFLAPAHLGIWRHYLCALVKDFKDFVWTQRLSIKDVVAPLSTQKGIEILTCGATIPPAEFCMGC